MYRDIKFVVEDSKLIWSIRNNKYDDFFSTFEFDDKWKEWKLVKKENTFGTLEFDNKWKQWKLVPKENTVWSMEHLADILDFAKQLQRLQ